MTRSPGQVLAFRAQSATVGSVRRRSARYSSTSDSPIIDTMIGRYESLMIRGKNELRQALSKEERAAALAYLVEFLEAPCVTSSWQSNFINVPVTAISLIKTDEAARLLVKVRSLSLVARAALTDQAEQQIARGTAAAPTPRQASPDAQHQASPDAQHQEASDAVVEEDSATFFGIALGIDEIEMLYRSGKINARANGRLHRLGLTTLAKVLAIPPEELMEKPGIGEVTINLLYAVLIERGLIVRRDQWIGQEPFLPEEPFQPEEPFL